MYQSGRERDLSSYIADDLKEEASSVDQIFTSQALNVTLHFLVFVFLTLACQCHWQYHHVCGHCGVVFVKKKMINWREVESKGLLGLLFKI